MELFALAMIALMAVWIALPVLAVYNLLRGLTASENKKRYFIRCGICVGLFMLTSALGMSLLLVPGFIKSKDQGRLSSCKSNLKNIATACEMYSTDFKGLYPPNLGMLTPNYLKVVPTCPAAEKDTYSDTYQVATGPDAFTFCCQGDNHKKASQTPRDFPQYSSREGLVERPR